MADIRIKEKCEQAFRAASKAKQLCAIRDTSGRTRIVEPYMIYTSSRGTRCYHVYQISGYSESGHAEGWKNPAAATIDEIVLVDRVFVIRPEYNPSNRKFFPKVHFSLPDQSGLEREISP